MTKKIEVMITKFKIFEKVDVYHNIIEEVTLYMKNVFDIDINFKITYEIPVELIIEFPNQINPNKDRWFFKVLQLIRNHEFNVHLKNNTMHLSRRKRREEEY